jgi:hypothetical protein
LLPGSHQKEPSIEHGHHEIESRRDGLNLAQDAVLGLHAPWKSPEGTTGKVVETWSWIREKIENFQLQTFSRPYGTFRLSNLYPGLRPGLSSAVPAGLIPPALSRIRRTRVSGRSSHQLWLARWPLQLHGFAGHVCVFETGSGIEEHYAISRLEKACFQ